MKTKIVKLPEVEEIAEVLKWPAKILEPLCVLITLMMLFVFTKDQIRSNGYPDDAVNPSLYLLIILSLICFIVISILCWWLLKRFWTALELPDLKSIISQFKTLTPWQQLSFYMFSFALLLFAALSCLSSIC